MAHAPSPGWLLPAYLRAVQGAGATGVESEISAAGSRLLERWEEPQRRYHNVRHLVDLLQHVDELQSETHHPHAVRLAAWYHGAVFDSAEAAAYARRGGEDEVASAEYARKDLDELGVPADVIADVVEMVQALSRHTSVDRPDCAVLCDADLAILAAEPQRYKAYTEDVRAEYAHIPLRDYLESRQAILRKLLAREAIYKSPLAAPWEEPARQNVEAEISRIERELAKLEPAAE